MVLLPRRLERVVEGTSWFRRDEKVGRKEIGVFAAVARPVEVSTKVE